eukprot:c19631_g1_i1 orf=199-1278(+)
MASHHGLLPASKEVVLEIQLNKLINDFLFSGVEDRMAATVGNASEDRRQHGDPAWESENPGCLSLENSNLVRNVGSPSHPSCVADVSNMIPAIADGQSPGNVPSKALKESTGMMFDHNKARCPASLPTTEEVRLDISEQKSKFCNVDKPQHTNKLKVFHLSRAHSVAGSLFCFSMERQEEEGKEKEEEKNSTGSIKLTRIGSLPCHSKLHSEAEREFKHTCRKPPRPPKSISEKGPGSLLSRHASTNAIFVLHSTSRRARTERRKRLAASSSSNASMWALIFTFCFAMAMVGEGFWSQSSPILAIERSFNATTADSHMELNTLMPSPGRTTQSSPHVPSQLEREMQMREFWISKGLDPS